MNHLKFGVFFVGKTYQTTEISCHLQWRKRRTREMTQSAAPKTSLQRLEICWEFPFQRTHQDHQIFSNLDGWGGLYSHSESFSFHIFPCSHHEIFWSQLIIFQVFLIRLSRWWKRDAQIVVDIRHFLAYGLPVKKNICFTGVIILPVQTMHYYKGNRTFKTQNYHIFA